MDLRRAIEERKKQIRFLKLCWNKKHDEDFRFHVTSGYDNSDYLLQEKYGDDYKGCIIYNIDAYGCNVGFFAEFLFTLIRLYYADERGLIPYVFWGKNFLYYDENDAPENNCFLSYFEPVSHVKEIKNASHVVNSQNSHIVAVQNHQLKTYGYTYTDEYVKAMSYIIKKYIHYNHETEEYLRDSYDKLIGNKKALAIHFRGTDYKRQYNNHPQIVTIEQAIQTAESILQKKEYDVVFLATDEEEAVEKIKNSLSVPVVYFEDTFRSKGGDESVAFSSDEREHHHFRLGLEVLRDQYMLTRCDGLVGGISNLTISAKMMRLAWYQEDYSDLVIIDNKLYKNDNSFGEAVH